MKYAIIFFVTVCTHISFLGAAASSEAPKQKKTWLSKVLSNDTTQSFWFKKKPHAEKKRVPRSVSFVGLPAEDEARIPRSSSAPQPISQLSFEGVIETPFIPAKLPSLFHEHLFYACYNFLRTQIERLPQTTITDSFPLRIKLYGICNATTISSSNTEEKPLEECIKSMIDNMRSDLATIFYAYILETVYKDGLPASVSDAFYVTFDEIIINAKLSEHISIKPPLD